MPITTRSKLKALDRVALSGTVTRLAPQPEGRLSITVDIGSAAPVTLDAMWSNRDAAKLKEGDTVTVEGSVERINRSDADAKWDTASIKLDGYAYRVTLHISEIPNAKA